MWELVSIQYNDIWLVLYSIVEEAISKYGESEILNTDQGSQFTSDEYVNLVINENNIKLSMNGKGRSLDKNRAIRDETKSQNKTFTEFGIKLWDLFYYYQYY